MDCPVCKEAMITLELDDVEIDHCVDCGGIWLDAGELELLIGEPSQAQVLLQSFRRCEDLKEKPRRCPICDKKMHKVLAASEGSDLMIDKCRRNDGLWFDRGELDEILVRAHLDEDHKIRQLLKDMFGQA
jgi:Zn-finger nucleic acid-binding protein